MQVLKYWKSNRKLLIIHKKLMMFMEILKIKRNKEKERKVLIVFGEMAADMLSNENII